MTNNEHESLDTEQEFISSYVQAAESLTQPQLFSLVSGIRLLLQFIIFSSHSMSLECNRREIKKLVQLSFPHMYRFNLK
jgi:translation initiation factor 2B subunit (eIF-2B alpha/beta/delta family)